MTPLRNKMIRELELCRKAPGTVAAYVKAVEELALHYRRSPAKISREEVRSYLHYLITQRKLAYSSCNCKMVAIKFFYREVLGQPMDLRVSMKKEARLPDPLSREEVARLMNATSNRKHRVLMMTTYSAGLRVSELVRLKPHHIKSNRMLIHVEQGKGRKDRYTLLSQRLLSELRAYWRDYRPLGDWLFMNQGGSGHVPIYTAARIFYRMKKRAGIKHGRGIHTLRHSFATHLLEEGVDLRTIQILMGHSSMKSTLKYLHITQKHLTKTQGSFDLLRLPRPGDVSA